ncbi:hypothetical protein [Rothia aeria]|uniref:hypothetical protein n=1 Tax=Rothia aeria TaxID=172042 RepID=UPI003C7E92D1
MFELNQRYFGLFVEWSGHIGWLGHKKRGGGTEKVRRPAVASGKYRGECPMALEVFTSRTL